MLVIEDEAIVRGLIVEVLQDAGFETVEDEATSDPSCVPDRLAPPFAALDDADRACMQMLTVHRRPLT